MNTWISANRAKLLIIALFIFLAGCSDNDNNSSSGAASPAGFNALLLPTFESPRCVNCHGFDEGNATRSEHVAAGRSWDCQECHGADVATWSAPFKSFSFTGLSSAAICEGSKNRSNSDLEFLVDHLKNDALILWGITNATTVGVSFQRAPPGSLNAWRSLVDQWVNNGAICD